MKKKLHEACWCWCGLHHNHVSYFWSNGKEIVKLLDEEINKK